MTDIADWLASIGLAEYTQRFIDNAIDLSILPDLTDQDLKDLGVLLGHRRKMLRAIARFDESAAVSTQPASETMPRDEGERRQITVMFCDLVGSTALAEQLDPEDMWRVIAAFHSCIGEGIGRYGGMIARYMGDGVLAYFGYPRAEEDDAEQAVRAALALVDAVADLQTPMNTALRIRIGIATGTVVVSEFLIDKTPAEQAVVGETPNLAARLQALAEPGAVLICPSTRRLTGGLFDYRELGPTLLKGITQAIPIWRVLGTSDVQSRFEAMHKSKLPPPLGREEEVEILWRRWQHAAAGDGRVVLLTGEPGIGKSHIALAFADRLLEEPHITLRHFCSAHHTNSALFPFIGQLERAAGFKRGDTGAEKQSKLEAIVRQSTGNAEHVAILAHLLGLQVDDSYGLQELSPQRRKEKTLAALLAQLEGLAAHHPCLAIFEDVHWIDPTSLDLLSAAVELAPKLRVLLLMTARPEFNPPWPSHPQVTTIPLTRLGRREGAALVERAAGGKALPREVMEEILARTDGVPLFIEELTKTVLESGMLQKRQDQYVLEGQMPSLAIPTTLQASLMARLDRLAPVREVAQIGAVAGREFHYELVNAVAGMSKEKLEEALCQLVEAELIFRRGEIPHAVYSFKHVLVRDAAYAGLLKSRRVQIHAAIADALEQQFPEVLQSEPETIARHLTEAGLVEKSIRYWLQAGKNAALRSANVEAIAHLERGFELLGRLPGGENRDRVELEYQMALGPCLIATKGPAASVAVSVFARAHELCKRLGDPPEYLQVLFWMATASVVRGELPQALEAIADLPRVAEAVGNRPALLNGIRGQAMILMFMGRLDEAREALQRALDLFNTTDETDKLAARVAGQDAGMSMLVLTAWVLWFLGRIDEAVEQLTAALKRADVVRHAHTHAYAWYYASVLYALRGEPTIARTYAEQCLAISEQHGFGQWLGLSRAIQVICTDAPRASGGQIEEVKTALLEYEKAGYHLGITAQYALLLPLLLRRRNPEIALEIIDHGLSIANHNEERLFEAELYRLKASALLMLGAPQAELEGLLEQALRTARSQNSQSLELRAASDLATLWMGSGQSDRAFNLLSTCYSRFTQGFETVDLKNAEKLLASLGRADKPDLA